MKTSKNQVTNSKQPNQYTVSVDGKAWISQSEVARLLNISQGAISSHIKTMGFSTNEFKQLDDVLLAKTIGYYARKGNSNAIKLLISFAIGGARAFIYYKAGLKLENPKLLLEEKDEQISELKEKVETLEKELRPVIDGEASVSQHLKLLGLKDRKLTTLILSMITDEVNHRTIKVPKFDREPKVGLHWDVKVNTGTLYDNVLVSGDLVEACLICLGYEY